MLESLQQEEARPPHRGKQRDGKGKARSMHSVHSVDALQGVQHALRRSGQMGTLVDFGGPRGDKHHFKGPACHDGEWSDRIIGCITRHAIDIGESGKDGCPSQCGQGLWFWNSVLRSIAIELGGMNTMSSSPACSKGEWSDGNIRML
ncbi:hypothetical protein F5J12DRAFT_788809 [Pisolithus orientalis]|uniref:uncharacterized protein n=1 Tax=Pisolithus orientalis TaxID=936130 RepID=UPI0022249205|nr:uncharacterized protein F5J12DRAFT_788809 [Pisolithus orientalis]KAI5981046.1 hypothetical protein F5J12DRAFT_788809 [Pisolithus orientalis]